MKKMRNILFVLTFLALSSTLLGHPGHGVTPGDSVAHISIDHFGLVALVLAVLTAIVLTFRSYVKKAKS